MRTVETTLRSLIAVLVAACAALPLVAGAANLTLTIKSPKTAAKNLAPIHYGQTRTWKAVVANLGPDLAQGTQITKLDLDPGLKLVGVTGCTAPDGQTDPIPCTIDANAAAAAGIILPEPKPTADPATFVYAKTVLFDVKLPMPVVDEKPTLPTTCPNGATLAGLGLEVADAAHDGATATTAPIVIGNWADLGITLEAPAASTVGDTFDVAATLTNDGPCDAQQVFANDSDPKFAQGITSLGIEFLGSTGACVDQDPTGFSAKDPTGTSCYWATLAPGDTQHWTYHYRVLPLVGSEMQISEIVSLTAYSTADLAFDYDSDNDVARTDTLVTKHQANCSTGGMGQALSLLALALPLLRRRRKV